MAREQTSQIALELAEREAELALVGRLLDDAAAGHGSVAVIEGAAGMGKTTLLRASTDQAREKGFNVLSALGLVLGDDLPWLTVRELFGPTLRDESETLFCGAAAMSAAVLDPGAVPKRTPDVSAAAMHGLYWLVANLADRGPLLLAIDDLQLVDTVSLRWLVYLARRLGELPVLLLATAPPGNSPLLACHSQVLALRSLSNEAARAIVGDSADPEFADACVDVAQGNPLLLRELLEELERNEVAPIAKNAPVVAETLPANVGRAVLLRVTRGGDHALRVARATAVLGTEATVRNVAELAGLDEDDTVAAIGQLEPAEVLARELPLRFVHPFARAAVYEDIAPAERTRWHRRAAALLARRGADPAAVAGQLLACEPAGDPVSVRLLQDAAAGALRTGAPDNAVRFLRRAREELPTGEDAALLRELGSAEASAADPEAAEHLRQALELENSPALRAQTAQILGSVLTRSGRPKEALEVLDDAIEVLGDDRTELRLRLEGEAIAAAREDFELRRVIPERLERLAGLEGATAAELVLLANMAMESASSGDRAVDETIDLAMRALAGGRLVDEETSDSPACYLAIHSLVAADRADLAIAHLDTAFADARKRGSVLGTAIASICASHAHYAAGDLATAVTHARTALEIASAAGWAGMTPWAVAFMVDALVDANELQEARAQVEASGLGGDLPELPFFAPVAESRARLALALRDPEEALRMARFGELLADCGSGNPAMSSWRSATATALAALGREDEALTLANEELSMARGYGAAQPIAAALRTVARLESDPGERVEHLREAATQLESSPARLEYAKTLVDLGAALRLAGDRRAAREPLRAGLDIATECAAHALAQKAHSELVAAGGRPRRPALTGVDALTPAELRVARMAADGLTNRDIAETLFVTVRTVELHLTHAYQKLGISSRSELGQALGS